jgi:cell division protein ZapA
MADVTVTINGHNYVVACKDGEEKHLHFLADYVSKKVQSLVVSFGQVGEARLLLMAALFCADELSESFSQLGDLKAEVADLKNRLQKAEKAMGDKTTGNGKASMDEEAVATLLNDTARRIEDLASRIERG